MCVLSVSAIAQTEVKLEHMVKREKSYAKETATNSDCCT